MEKKTFVFNTMWREVLRAYPAEVRLEVYEAIMDYVASGTLSELKPLSNMAFQFIKHEIDFNNEKYEEALAKKREAGRQGGLARVANQANQANPSTAKQTQANQANPSIYDNVNDNVIKKKDNSNELSKKESRFFPPSVDDVRAYCQERGNNVDAERFINHYTSNGWMVGKNKMKDWKAAVRTWERSSIPDRPASRPATLGIGEYMDGDRRTYGSGSITIPDDAPPRPSISHAWNPSARQWVTGF